MRQAFEDGLAASPDDVATHRAYADWLVEQGDARGELIQVQLALEQGGSDELRQREAALLAEHQGEWLGELAEHFEGRDDITFSFRRGWLDEITVERMREEL